MIGTRACEYQGVKNVSFFENFAYVLNGWPLNKLYLKYLNYLGNKIESTEFLGFSQKNLTKFS